MTCRCSRRRLLAGTASLAAAGLAGCLGDEGTDDSPAEPISLADGQSCDACGMVIADHFGPAGQLFYADGRPEERDGPLRYDSLSELVVARDEHEAQGGELRGAFVTDYSSVDYDLAEHDGTPHISTHAEEAAFADATELYYVVESDVHGAMGPDLLPFSDRGDAERVADDHGGDVREWDELSTVG
ncbi:nitrous oxide reductase accessory protein NosL [Natronorubrum sp. JWXQ-INN-674]|uniref:Nitrous oxide reductase accessory protein NosL n=1 Tax=Natronorubrum halalkaliphilum TaxID=2691917 RepID=A0A6B0VPW0_9EURY|nr:nitrous oxide reductase accessory protein NosL [Natronorubrum halalkaliphilum]MXV63203.1 nitrous oxide reductase accessory protein NosL [Natronorubrum halalkaliphilum]